VVNGTGGRQSGYHSSGDFCISSVRGVVVGSVGAVGCVVNTEAAVPRPATATELALVVIPLNNGIKKQLGEVQLALNVLPPFQTAITELKVKYTKLSERLVKTDAVLKSLDDWFISNDFARIKKAAVPLLEKVPVVAPIIQAFVGCTDSESLFVGGVLKSVGSTDLVEMSILDIEIMFS